MNLFKKLFKRKLKATQDTQTPPDKVITQEIQQERHFSQPLRKLITDVTFIYCLVGNIVEERFSKSEQKTFRGTKHFSPGTKVYCFPPQWGDGYEMIKVIGRHRNSARMVTMVIASKNVTNWRLKTVYNPFVIKEMINKGGWRDRESDKESINKMAASLNKSDDNSPTIPV